MLFCMIVLMALGVGSLFALLDNAWMYIYLKDEHSLQMAIFFLFSAIASIIGFFSCYMELFGL